TNWEVGEKKMQAKKQSWNKSEATGQSYKGNKKDESNWLVLLLLLLLLLLLFGLYINKIEVTN
ncbi:MAG: hypothetical protein N7Q72_02165, partial [Spiroplasma sp. Tabriz.8]|nr:hypothetical protein [Spiroplasma sp. Tabriz.8]